MVNYLIVMPRIVKYIGEWYRFPVGICYVSSSLKAAGYSVYSLNLNHRKGELYNILSEEIEKNKIDVIAVGGITVQYNSIKQLIDIARKIKPNIVTIVGGGVITASPDVTMRGIENADYGIIGEGEYTICELADAINNQKPIENIAGLVYRKQGQIILTEKRTDIADLGSLSWPDYEGFDADKLIKIPPNTPTYGYSRYFSMVTSRSCTHNCTFCFHSSGRTYRQRPLDDVFNEIEYLIRKYNVGIFEFIDELFAIDLDRTRIFCEKMRQFEVPWICQIRANIATPELLKLLKWGGCVNVGFGIESMDDRVLKSMKKNITSQQIQNALEITTNEGIHTGGNLIFGDLEETLETSNRSLEWWENNQLCDINLGMIQVYPGTHLYKYAIKNGIINDELKYIEDGCPLINVSKLTDQEYSSLIDKIDEYSLSKTLKPNVVSLESINKDTNKVSVKAVCCKCNAEQIWENVDVLQVNSLSCNSCGKKYTITLIEYYIEHIDKKLQSLMLGGKVALWGRRTLLYDLINRSKCFANNKIVIVDKSEGKQNSNILGVKVNSPAILSDSSFSTVIVTCVDYLENIKEEIRAKYPHIKNVMSMYDLLP